MIFAPPERLLFEMTANRPRTIVCDVSGVAANAVALDALARLQLHARRLGMRVRLRGASTDLLDLLDLAGLREVLGVESGGQVEEREERLGVEEERELGDPTG